MTFYERLAVAQKAQGHIFWRGALRCMGVWDRQKRACVWLEEALSAVDKTGERIYAAELPRLQGALLLQSGARGTAAGEVNPHAEVAEAC